MVTNNFAGKKVNICSATGKSFAGCILHCGINLHIDINIWAHILPPQASAIFPKVSERRQRVKVNKNARLNKAGFVKSHLWTFCGIIE